MPAQLTAVADGRLRCVRLVVYDTSLTGAHVMSAVMTAPSVAVVDDRETLKPALTAPFLPLVDNGVKVAQAPVIDGETKRQSSSTSSVEEGAEKSPPPPPSAIVRSPSTSAVSASNYLKDQIISFFQVSDNKLAMKLFGNKNALMREKLRQRAAGNWVIHPCSNFRQVFL